MVKAPPTPKGQKKKIAIFIDAANFEISLKSSGQQADKFIDLRDCEFVMKKPPFGGAHNNLSTAKSNILKKGRKVK